MDLGVHQRPYWYFPPDFPDGQCCQVKNYDMSSGGDPVGNVRGGGWAEKYGKRSYLPGNDVELSSMPRLRG